MTFQRNRIDRAQRDRARRLWWERHGSFTREMITALALAALVAKRLVGSDPMPERPPRWAAIHGLVV